MHNDSLRGDTGNTEDPVETFLRGLIGRHGAVAGTVHLRDGEQLLLRASVNIPPPVVEATRSIPRGKGMAGLAWSRDRPVQTCNLRDDDSGDVRPGAKAVNAKAAVAMPVRDGEAAQGGLRAVVGLAFMFERDLGEDEVAAMQRDAETLPRTD